MIMKKLTAMIVIIILLFTTVLLSGCEEQIFSEIDELKSSIPNYINVTITTKACLFKWNGSGSNDYFEILPGAEIKIKMDKASGEGRIFYATTGEDGWTPEFTHSFNVYREQPVNLYASLYPSVPRGLSNYSISSYYQQLTWNDIHSQADFGESYHWKPNCEILAYPPDYYEN
jgi:hypothetical protein